MDHRYHRRQWSAYGEYYIFLLHLIQEFQKGWQTMSRYWKTDVPVRNAKALARAMDEIEQKDDLRNKMSANNMEAVKKYFTEPVARLYEKLIFGTER